MSEVRLIDANALKKAIEKYRNLNCVSTSTIIGVRNVMYLIDNAQAVPLPSEQIAWEQGYKAGLAQGKQDRTKGEWIPMNPDCRGYSDYFKCSICGAYIYPNIPEKELDYNGCPYCFADMQKGGKE